MMTFSIALRCPETGHFGIAGAASSISMGARCLFVDHDAGAVITQHRTDPRLGLSALRYLRNGLSASEALNKLVGAPGIEWRELAIVDRNGSTALRQGAHQQPIYANATGAGMVAVGNILRNDRVPAAMVAAAVEADGKTIAERLLAALEAAEEAGGEIFPLRSSAIKVAEHGGFCSVDLRVDYSPKPLRELRRLWETYEPQKASFVERVLEPDSGGRATNSLELLASEEAAR
ncbi:DUF1028 domain-containing protein [Microvirga guangxiensis]|uniref:Uncharacterized conserved protein, Ntn-hydrolase superfamily n=1 Tax=Microvirga guangxiensis TaxID=549386 RepID=A0A1G5K058_9HYPH|nr:DUF1028 domain-containing protein [Microvirga guangxiensis]SCY93398.1 Uncharacterized conserved protein, Ntn-hydrolase superfamily [Microvirga guangxiensis]